MILKAQQSQNNETKQKRWGEHCTVTLFYKHLSVSTTDALFFRAAAQRLLLLLLKTYLYHTRLHDFALHFN